MAAKRTSKRKYGKKAQSNVEKAMRARKKGTLRSGSGAKVKSKKQAVAIALSEARKSGGKVPRKASSKRKASGGSSKRKTSKRTTKS
jgi:hypothetical protein